MKDQLKLFLKVILGFGQLYLAVNVLFLTEILSIAFDSSSQFQPQLVLDHYYSGLNYVPGTPIETFMRAAGAVLFAASLHLNWKLYASSERQLLNSLVVNIILLVSFLTTIVVLQIQVFVLYNSLGFIIANGILLFLVLKNKGILWTFKRVSPGLLQVYEQALYQIKFEGDWQTIMIGQTPPDLFNERDFGLVFSYNPYSEILSETENQDRQRNLIKVCQDKKYEVLECRGGEAVHSSTSWDWEYGLAVFNESSDIVEGLGRQFEQNAVVYCPAHGVPYLVVSL